MAMGRWVVEATTALACSAEAATILEALRSCSTPHPYLSRIHDPRCGVTPYDVSTTPSMSGYAHGPRTSHGHG